MRIAGPDEERREPGGDGPSPAYRAASGRLMRLAGLIGMLVGAAMVIGTYTGVLRGAGGDKNLGYTIGGLVAAYGLFRFLQGGRQR